MQIELTQQHLYITS